MPDRAQIAAAQRQRSLLVYNRLGCLGKAQFQLIDGSQVGVNKFETVDAGETKYIVTGLETDWGLHPGAVAIRSSDTAFIQFSFGQSTKEA